MRAIALLILATATAVADPAHDQAELLFKQGRDLLAAGKLAEACESFARSDQAEPAATTLIALGVCREKNGQLATAWTVFQEAGKRLEGAKDPASKQLAQVAAADAAKVEARVSHLTIAVAADHPPGLEVRRGDAIVPSDAWNTPMAIDGGTYAISVHAPGRETWTTTITVAVEKDAARIDVPVLAPVAVAVAPRQPPPPPPIAPAPARSRTVPIAVGIGALVLGGIAIGLDVSAHHVYDQAKVEPDDAMQTSLWHTANTRLYTAQGVGAGAAIAAGFAVYLFVRGGREQSPAIAIAPVVSSDQLGLAIGGRY